MGFTMKSSMPEARQACRSSSNAFAVSARMGTVSQPGSARIERVEPEAAGSGGVEVGLPALDALAEALDVPFENLDLLARHGRVR